MPRVANQRLDARRSVLAPKSLNAQDVPGGSQIAKTKTQNVIPSGRQLARTPVDKVKAETSGEAMSVKDISAEAPLPSRLAQGAKVEIRKRQNSIPSGNQLARTPNPGQESQGHKPSASVQSMAVDTSSEKRSNAIPTGRQLARTPADQTSQPLPDVSNLVPMASTTQPPEFGGFQSNEVSEPARNDEVSISGANLPIVAEQNVQSGTERRLKSGKKRAGTGRVTKKRDKPQVPQVAVPTPTYGNRTGFQLVSSVTRDDNGFEDINSFWGETPIAAPVVKSSESSKIKSTEPSKLRLSILSDVIIDSTNLPEADQTVKPASPHTTPKVEDLNMRAPSSVLKIASGLKFKSKAVLRESLDRRNLVKRRPEDTPTEDPHDDVQPYSDFSDFEDTEPAEAPQPLDPPSDPHESQDSTGPTQIVDRSRPSIPKQESISPISDNETFEFEDEDPPEIREEPMITPKVKPRKLKKKSVRTPKSAISTTSSAASGGGSVCSESSEEYQMDLGSGESEDDESLPAMTPKSSTLSKPTKSSKKRRAKSQRGGDEEEGLEEIGERALTHKSFNAKNPTPGLRRSRRRKWNPLQHWKGERLLIVKGRDSSTGIEVPEVVAAAKPGVFKTPKPPRHHDHKRIKPAKLPKGFHPDRASTPVRVNLDGEVVNRVVVREAAKVHVSILPETKKRSIKVNGKVVVPKPPKAGAAFDDDVFLSGIVQLPPLSTKSEENTNRCTQVFMVNRCQPNSVCVRVADRKYVLSQGDHFWVPTSSYYSIQNFSATVEANLSFVLIKPTYSR